MYIFRRAAARAVSAPRQLRASPRVTSFQSSIPSLSRTFHQSRIWRAEEQKKEAQTSSSTAEDALSESSGTTSEPLGQSEAVSGSASETTTTPTSSTTSSGQDALSESSGTTSGSESKPVLEQASEIAEKAKETVSDAAAKAAQAVGEFTQQPKEKAQDAAVYASEQASEAASKISEQASETASKVNEQASEATSQVSEQAQSAAATATRAARNTAASARDNFRSNENREIVPSKILYIGNLFFEVTAPQLEAEFAKYGEVSNSRVVTDDRGLSKGFAYIEFANQAQADAAREALDQKSFQGRRLSVQYHKRREERSKGNLRRDSARGPAAPSKTLFIGNMSYQMSDRDLNDLFRSIKNVLDVRVAIDRRSGQPRGFAHADFTDVESAVTAKKALEQKSVYGRQLRIDYSGQAKENDRPERSDRFDRRERREPREPRDGDSF